MATMSMTSSLIRQAVSAGHARLIPFLRQKRVTPEQIFEKTGPIEGLVAGESRDGRGLHMLASSPYHSLRATNPDFDTPRVLGLTRPIGHATPRVPFVWPDHYQGLEGRVHTAMMASVLEAAFESIRSRLGFDDEDVAHREMIYSGSLRTGEPIVIEAGHTKIPYQSFFQLCQVGKVICRAEFTRDQRRRYQIPERRYDLSGGVLFRGMMSGSVSSGHNNLKGLHFKMSYHADKNVLSGVISPHSGQNPIHAMHVAADDISDYAGLRAAKTWGFTTDRCYQEFRKPRSYEQISVVCDFSAIQLQPNGYYKIPVQFIATTSEVISVMTITFVPHRLGMTMLAADKDTKAALQMYLGHLQATERSAYALDQAAWQYYTESLGENFGAEMAELELAFE